MKIYGSKVFFLLRFKIEIHFITDSRCFNNKSSIVNNGHRGQLFLDYETLSV